MPDRTAVKTPLVPIFRAYNKILGGKSNSFRPYQLQFMVTCYEGVVNKRPVVIEGPTGLGKTKALLSVGVAYLTSHPSAQVLYTTRTMPQLQNIDRDMKELSQKGVLTDCDLSHRFSYCIYIGIGSIRRLFCTRYLSGVTTDPDALKACRAMLDDPDKPEPCPDCNIRDTRSRRVDEYEMKGFVKYGLEEMKASLKEELCPVAPMRACASQSAFVLTTYPYLMNDFWKASVLGFAEKRKKCLPLIDEAHNLIENITEHPAMVISLTKDFEPGQGLDLSGNVYYLATLVDDIKYGYRQAVLGRLNTIFINIVDSEKTEQGERISSISGLKKKHKALCEEARSLKQSFSDLVSHVKIFQSGTRLQMDSLQPFAPELNQASDSFSKAADLARARDDLTSERHTLKQ